jgi:hypothetical protein
MGGPGESTRLHLIRKLTATILLYNSLFVYSTFGMSKTSMLTQDHRIPVWQQLLKERNKPYPSNLAVANVLAGYCMLASIRVQNR